MKKFLYLIMLSVYFESMSKYTERDSKYTDNQKTEFYSMDILKSLKHIPFFLLVFILTLTVLYKPTLIFGFEKTTYHFSNDPIDVVIPCTEKDISTLDQCIEGIRKNCHNVNRIIVVSSKCLTDKAEWYDESLYPFSKYDIAAYLNHHDEESIASYLKPGSRIGWYYQQLLKLYSPFVIPGISTNVLIVDSDVIFLNPVKFLDNTGAGLYTTGKGYHKSYFEHAQKLISGLKKVYHKKSGISHHMLFQKIVLRDLFNYVENQHHTEFWKAFCTLIDPQELDGSGASEYEIYFNFVFSRTDQVKIRKLKWKDSSLINKCQYFRNAKYHYVAFHSYLR